METPIYQAMAPMAHLAAAARQRGAQGQQRPGARSAAPQHREVQGAVASKRKTALR